MTSYQRVLHRPVETALCFRQVHLLTGQNRPTHSSTSGSPNATVINPAKRALYLNVHPPAISVSHPKLVRTRRLARRIQSIIFFLFYFILLFVTGGVKYPLPIAIPAVCLTGWNSFHRLKQICNPHSGSLKASISRNHGGDSSSGAYIGSLS
jgi:hypothetical protein